MVSRNRAFLTTLPLSLLSLLFSKSVVVVESQCVVCGEDGPASVPWKDKELGIAGIPVSTCGSVEAIALALTPDSELCGVVQSVGTMCGCNKPPNACSLCWDGSEVTLPQTELPQYPASQFVATAPPGVVLNCETLQALVHRIDENDQQCHDMQTDAGETCGCPLPPDNHNNSTNTNTTTIAPSQQQNETEAPSVSRCSLCPFGESVPYPYKVLNVDDNAISTTCGDWENFALAVTEGSNDCGLFHYFSLYCGCAVPETACSLCPNGEAVPKPHRYLDWFHTSFVSTQETEFQSRLNADKLTCDLMASIVAGDGDQLSNLFGMDEDLLCTAVQLKSWVCGCSPDWRQILLTWSYRLSGLLSLMGSFFIAYDVLRTNRKNRLTVYQQLVLGISAFDSVGSLAYVLVGVMAPHEAGFHLSVGNDATCTTQGFMIQLGHTSMFYNVCLSLYFLLVISYNKKEHELKKWNPLVHAVVLLVGAGMAFGAIPFIRPQFGVCGILPPLTSSQWQVSLFYTAPVCIVLFILTTVTGTICYKVYAQQKKALKWTMDHRFSLTRKVFWQSFWYVMAFYSTLPFVLLTFYIDFTTSQHFWLLVLAAVLAPLQGFMNALVYFQRSRRQKMLREFCRCLLPRVDFWKSEQHSSRVDTKYDTSENPHSCEDDQPSELIDGMGVDELRIQLDKTPEEQDLRVSAVTQHWLLNEEWDKRSYSKLSKIQQKEEKQRSRRKMIEEAIAEQLSQTQIQQGGGGEDEAEESITRTSDHDL